MTFVVGKDFKSSETLRMHEQIHQDKATHKCAFCDKTFKQQPSLYTHMKTHTRTNMYKCQMCSKEFVTKYRLKNHVMRHNGERPSKLFIKYCAQKLVIRWKQDEFSVLMARLHRASASELRELCDEGSDNVVVENSGVTPEQDFRATPLF